MNEPFCATWSLVARDPVTGQLGVATASRYLGVGAVVPSVRPGVAAVCTQAWAKRALAPVIFAAITDGATPEKAVQVALAGDDLPGRRQIGVVDHLGRTAAYTGADVQADEQASWWGHVAGDGFVAIGNTLTGAPVVEATAGAVIAGVLPGETFGLHLLMALYLGEAAGGDHRGKQAAAVLVGGLGEGASEYMPAVDYRVDDHPAPIAELMRIYRIAFPATAAPSG